MDDLAQTFMNFLSNPENKKKIDAIKEKFLDNSSEQSERVASESSQQEAPENGFSPETLSMISKIAPLLSAVKEEDPSTKLLQALRPLLNEKRKNKLDESMKIFKIIKILPLLKEKGIL